MTIRYARKCKHQIQSMSCMKPWETRSSDACARACQGVCEPHSALRLRSPTNIGDPPTYREDVVVKFTAPVYHSTITCPKCLAAPNPNNEATKNASSRIEHSQVGSGCARCAGCALGHRPGLHGLLDRLQHRFGDLAQFTSRTCLRPFAVISYGCKNGSNASKACGAHSYSFHIQHLSATCLVAWLPKDCPS